MADIFCLSTHATYGCRHSGACCSSNWAIPVEVPLYRQLTDALADGTLPQPDLAHETTPPAPQTPFVRHADVPSEFAAVLRTRADGTCAFFDRSARLCDIHRHKGHAWLPDACQQFPRVSLLDRRGLFVTLSHYCPTAADLLFDDDGPIRLVMNPPAFPRDGAYDGLDAREAFPPLLRPGVLMDWDTLSAWDRFACDRLDREAHDVDTALADLQRACDHLRRWTAAEGPLASRLAAATAQAGAAQTPPTRASASARAHRAWRLSRAVRACVPPSSATATTTAGIASYAHGDRAADTAQRAAHERQVTCADDVAELSARWIDPVWPVFTRPLCRYVAAKLCGNWCWYQGAGLRTVLRSVESALACVRVEAARQVGHHGRMLDRRLLHESVRQADLLLVHLAARDALARRWSTAEDEDGDEADETHEREWTNL